MYLQTVKCVVQGAILPQIRSHSKLARFALRVKAEGIAGIAAKQEANGKRPVFLQVGLAVTKNLKKRLTLGRIGSEALLPWGEWPCQPICHVL